MEDEKTNNNNNNNNNNNDNPGIISMECYFPKLYICQEEFEKYNKVSAGKYTIGLGQKEMSFVSDREDICSISMTVLSRLMEKNKDIGINYKDIGWICVATETILDHSKSISSMLMQLFESKGNHEIEGIDVKHACYAGTFALFSAFDRISSKYWDGKYCIVIAADIAEYKQGPARCTGGCGAVALLIGKNGCIELQNIRSSFKSHQYDFYKPNLNSPYPVVNGHVSNSCYINALDSCYNGYHQKILNQIQKNVRNVDIKTSKTNTKNMVTLANMMDYWIFHAPYNKLVKKSFGRILYNDFIKNQQYFYDKYQTDQKTIDFLKKYAQIPAKDTMNTREVIKGFETMSKPIYKEKVSPSTYIPQLIGNCYTASVFMGLISLISQSRHDIKQKLGNKKIAIFSYGSGTLASMYSLKVNSSLTAIKQLNKICDNNDIETMIKNRTKIDCQQFTEIMNQRDDIHKLHEECGDVLPSADISKSVSLDAYYLTKIDSKKQRFYEKHVEQETSKMNNPYLDTQLIQNLNEMTKITKVPNQQKLLIDNPSNDSFKDFDPSQLQKAVDGVIAQTSGCYY